jgi:hypothetical protein
MTSSAVEVAHERGTADRAEHEIRAAEQHVPLRVAGVQLELARRLRDQGLHLPRIEADVPGCPVDPCTGTRECGERPIPEDLHPDLGQDPQRRQVDRLDLVLGQDLDRPVRIDEPAPRQLPDATGHSPRPAVHSLGLGHARMLRGALSVLRRVSASAALMDAVIRRACRP